MADKSNEQVTRTTPQLQRLHRWAKDLIFIGIVAVGAMAARSSLADHYHVPSGSMLPTVHLEDRIVVNKLAYGVRLPFTSVYLAETGEPRAGDVVVLTSPDDGIVLLKRVAATPGSTVEVRDGHLVVDGREVPVRFDGDGWSELLGETTHPLSLAAGGGPDYGPTTLPARTYLVLGDNRGDSRDGRVFGLVDREAILGRAAAVYRRDGEFVWLEL